MTSTTNVEWYVRTALLFVMYHSYHLQLDFTPLFKMAEDDKAYGRPHVAILSLRVS